MTTPPAAVSLSARLRAAALAQGFESFGIVRAAEAPDGSAALDSWLAAGMHGDMEWMRETRDQRVRPQALWPQARSVIVVGMNYGPSEDPRAALAHKAHGAISVYARNRDYHEIMKGRLKLFAAQVIKLAGAGEVKVFVDTAPVMEKPLAEAAGLGWQGKHSNLVSRAFGSWLFLGALFTALDLAPDAPGRNRCGACRACLDACPTQAFAAPYVLDARRCIAYLTNEHKGSIARDLRPAIGNRIYGCDDCLAVCPWNKFAQDAREAKLVAREDFRAPPLADLLSLDDARFRALFSANPVKRIGLTRFLRNVLIAAGNAGAPELAAPVARLIDHADPLVRGTAVWALARLAPREAFAAAHAARAKLETDSMVLEEWRAETERV